MKLLLPAACAVLALATGLPAWGQGHAHAHGRLTLDVAVDAKTITLQLDAPLHDLLGFERAPRSVAERGRVTALLAQLQAADKLFVPDPAAGCQLADVQIVSPMLGQGGAAATAGKADPASEHADLALTAAFACAQASAARFIDVKLFDAFQGVRSIEVQLATAKGQARTGLRKTASRLALDATAPAAR